MVLARRFLEIMGERRRAEGLAEGLVQGETQRQEKWESWNYRRMQAQEEGREFNEPPPSLDAGHEG